MTGFGALLARLPAYQQTDLGALTTATGITESDVRAVLNGMTPSPSLLRDAMPLTAEQRHRLRQFARALPQEERTTPTPPPRPWQHYPPGPGAVIVGLLHNRNLDWLSAARTLGTLTDRYLSAATIGMVGRGRVEPTPDLLADFATMLDIPAGILTALTGIGLPEPTPAEAGMAELIWEARRLPLAQLDQVRAQAARLRQSHLP
ncbi:hypothetical protein [Actinomadura macrotermitis]|nr:hypothetical protein [Actinomadura macrotermitis]